MSQTIIKGLTINGGNVTVNPKSGIAYQRPQLTGATTSYRTGDDQWNENNNPYPAPPTNPVYIAELSDFTTLKNNNVFGNTNRFTDDLGGQTYTNDYVIDHYTGLGWYDYDFGDNDWNDHIDQAYSATTLGFTDWRVPNLNEMVSILNYGKSNMLDGSPFTNIVNIIIRTSTTRKADTTRAWYCSSSTGVVNPIDKTSTYNIRACQIRNHYD